MVTVLNKVPSFGEQFARGSGRALGSALSGAAEGYAQKQALEKENEAVERLTGKNLRGLSPESRKTFIERLSKLPEQRSIKDALIKQGISEDDAELYSILSTGGQTEFAKALFESKKRGMAPGIYKQDQEQPKEELSPEESLDKELQHVLSEQDKGLTPSERVARGKERYTTGQKVRSEATTRLHGLTRDKERLGILESLNSSDKLPKDLSRLNVDADGNLRLPFTASSEAQRYVKTLNEFISGAKDSFGARVTNFDLATYLKQFPTLMNSKEGRKQLLQQMKIINDINSVYYKNLQKVFDKAGGARKIDTDVAESIAEKMSEPQIEKMSSKFGEIGTFSSLPNPSEFPGKTMRDKDTGELFKSDGQNWIPQG